MSSNDTEATHEKKTTPRSRRPAPTDAAHERVSYRPCEVAALLGMGCTRTRQLIAAGRIQSFRLGSCVLVSRSAVLAFVADAEAGASGGRATSGGRNGSGG